MFINVNFDLDIKIGKKPKVCLKYCYLIISIIFCMINPKETKMIIIETATENVFRFNLIKLIIGLKINKKC